MSDEQVRKEFEAWHKEHSGISLMRHTNGGDYVYAESEWQLWLSRQAEIGLLKSELEASKKDAERYRWLSKQLGKLRIGDRGSISNVYVDLTGASGPINEFVDAAMEAK